MMRALYTGASGLKSHQTRMDVVGNNISNVNTTGYKSTRATFQDILSQNLKGATSGGGTVGGTNPIQIGLGTKVASTDLMFRDGSVLSTGKNTDLAISGDGLFVVTKGNQTYYTRNGDFEFDAAGNYVLPGSGHFVQGWTATDGVIDTTGAVGNINVAVGQTMPAKATDLVSYLDNLDADIPMITGISGGDTTGSTLPVASQEKPITLTLSNGTTRIMTEGSYQVGNSMPISATATVYDSMGNTYDVPVYFVREGEFDGDVVNSTNKWMVSLSPDSSVTSGQETSIEFTDAMGNPVSATLAATEIQFDSSGRLVTNSGEAGATTNFGTLVINSSATTVDPTTGVETTAPVTQSVNLDFNELTQFSGSTTINANGNGNAEGTLKEIQIDSSGAINGIYTNGVKRPEAQVALAHFTNEVGLFKYGTSLYQQSDNSGIAVIGESQNFGVTLTPGALEMSNVDVANEFADMIVTQRGFQSNAKIVTVGDEMIETAVNMKR